GLAPSADAELPGMSADRRSAEPPPASAAEVRPVADVFLAADDLRVATQVSGALSAAGFAIRRAESAEGAVQAIARSRPSAVIVDLALPRPHDGYWVLDAIRSNPATRHFPIVALI